MKTQYQILTIWIVCIVVTSFCAAGQPNVGKVSYEDMNSCKLPNGIQELLKRGSPKAMNLKGFIFNFVTKKLDIDPLTKQDKEVGASYKEIRDAIIAAKTGDIVFDSVESHSLVAISGRIKNLGKHYLYDFNKMKMTVPDEVFQTEEGETAPGVLTNVNIGECFLMTTLDGELVLLRLIGVDNDRRCCTIQWVKANKGSNTFEIPKGKLIQPQEDRSSGGQITLSDEVKSFQNRIAIYSNNRKQLVEYCLSVLSKRKYSIDTLKDLNVHVETNLAIRTLGEIRAEESTGLLAKLIDIPFQSMNSSYEDTVDTLYGCVWALVKIGKPSAAACLKEIINLTPAEWDNKDKIKPKLLLLVILRVEGENFTKQILEDFKNSLTDKQQVENLDKAISLMSEVKSWGGLTDNVYSQLKKELLETKPKQP
jgi:hypothetical protein